MSLFSQSQIEQINKVVVKAQDDVLNSKPVSAKSIGNDLAQMSQSVLEYFKDSPAILITTEEQLHDYVDKCIEYGYAGIDTETTGLDRVRDHVVGASLYVPGMPECYIPMKHVVPIFEQPYKNQLSYEQVKKEFDRLRDCKLIFANADYDLAMIWKDIKTDFNDACYYDVIIAWRCLKEDELKNDLKSLYIKYVLRGQGDPKKFTDFFSPKLFPYCKPEVAKLYAANDAKITFDLFKWQLPYLTPSHPKCQKGHFEKIAALVWNIEFPMIKVCQNMFRRGMYLDKYTGEVLNERYGEEQARELKKLQNMVQEIIDANAYKVPAGKKRPFTTGDGFNPESPVQVKYLLYDLMQLPKVDGQGTGKEVLHDLNLPVTNQILKVRSLGVLINTFVKKMPRATTSDSRIHGQFKQIGAATGRMCIAKGTKITVLNGEKNIEDIQPGDLVYCYDDVGNLQLSKVKNLWLTGKSRDCVRIKWQSSGSGDIGELICTPEHNILTKSGEWVEAKDLKRYDKLAHLRRTRGYAPDYRPALYGWNNLSTREQDVVKYSVFGLHPSDKWVIHHKDGNPSNNELSNLEPKLLEEHSRYHSKERSDEGLIKYGHLQDKDVQAKAHKVEHEKYIERTKARRDELIAIIESVNGRISKVPGDFNSFKHQCEVAGVDIEEECRKYNPRYHKPDISEDEFLRVYEQFNGLAVRITEYFNISYDKFYSYCRKYNISRNHMVQSVEPCGQYDVYDIEVETCHNFIANEICVHNSSANPNLQNIPSHAVDIRHLFRATPSMHEELDCTDIDENTVTVTTSRWNSVHLEDDTEKYINDLHEGETVKTLEARHEVLCTVKEITFKLGDATLVLVRKE